MIVQELIAVLKTMDPKAVIWIDTVKGFSNLETVKSLPHYKNTECLNNCEAFCSCDLEMVPSGETYIVLNQKKRRRKMNACV